LRTALTCLEQLKIKVKVLNSSVLCKFLKLCCHFVYELILYLHVLLACVTSLNFDNSLKLADKLLGVDLATCISRVIIGDAFPEANLGASSLTTFDLV